MTNLYRKKKDRTMSDDLVKRDFLIFKRGRGWYRAESKGYTAFKFDAGRYTKQDAEKITHPNGLDGPRDGMFYKHESEVSDFPSDRIEKLEAKLAKAMEVVEMIASADVDAVLGQAVDLSCEIIGELMEEEDDERTGR
jgi:hypothetical protein